MLRQAIADAFNRRLKLKSFHAILASIARLKRIPASKTGVRARHIFLPPRIQRRHFDDKQLH